MSVSKVYIGNLAEDARYGDAWLKMILNLPLWQRSRHREIVQGLWKGEEHRGPGETSSMLNNHLSNDEKETTCENHFMIALCVIILIVKCE